MDFFSKCQTKEQAKELFRKLSKCFHPDVGGEQDLQIELKKQFDNWKPSQSNRTQTMGNFQTSLTEEEYQSSFGAAYSYNPRVEILEAEIRRLKYELSNSPDMISMLRSNINNYKERLDNEVRSKFALGDVIRDLKSEIKVHAKEIKRLEDENISLKYQIVSLQSAPIEEVPHSLWDKIKYVMGNNSAKA